MSTIEEEFNQKYPELMKWDHCCMHYSAIEILNFLEWLVTHRDFAWLRIHSYQDFVYEYFKIDEDALERERHALIEEIRRSDEEEKIDG